VSDDNNAQAGEQGPPLSPPKLRPHLVVVRTITYRGDAEAIKQLLDHSLPDALMLAGNGAFTIEVETAPIKYQQPEWFGVVKQELGEKERQAVEKATREQAQKQGARILNPHTLRPVN